MKKRRAPGPDSPAGKNSERTSRSKRSGSSVRFTPSKCAMAHSLSLTLPVAQMLLAETPNVLVSCWGRHDRVSRSARGTISDSEFRRLRRRSGSFRARL